MSFLVYPPPRYHGVTGERTARYRPVDTPPDLVSGGGDPTQVTGASAEQRLHHLATGASTGGEFGLYRIDMPPNGMGPKAHFHRTMSESFFILSGSVALYNGERWIDTAPGDFLYVPVGGLHGFRNATDEPASMLLLFSPGAPREPYFATLADPTGLADMSDEERREFYLRHDNIWV